MLLSTFLAAYLHLQVVASTITIVSYMTCIEQCPLFLSVKGISTYL